MSSQTESRIYVNSYMMKSSGDDTDFILDLGTQYNFNYIQLDQAVIENQFCNFYESFDTDFRIMSVQLQDLTTYTIKIDQHVNGDQLVRLFNENNFNGINLDKLQMEIINQAVDVGKRIFQCRFKRVINGVVQANYVDTRLIGGAWKKLGFETDILQQIHIGTYCYDFMQPPAILVQFENIPNVMKSKYGSYSFSIPNTATFGQRIYYNSTVENGCQHIHLPYEVSVNQLHIRLLNCDFKKLETARQNADVVNQNNIECIFVFTLRKV